MGGERQVGLVLLHGAELGAWIWERVLPLLTHRAVAVDLPGRGRRPARGRDVRLAHAVDAIVSDAERLGTDRIAVVAHSFSGVLAPSVTSRLGDRATAAVFVGGSVPVVGRAWLADLPLAQRLLLRTMYRMRPDGLRSPASQNRTTLCHDLDDDATAAVLERRVAEPPGPMLEPVGPAELRPSVARHYVRLTEDRSVPLATQDRHVARLGPTATVHELASGHLPMLSHPRELAALLDRLVEER